MLSSKFIVLVLVAIVIVFGFGIFPAFNPAFRTIPTAGMSTQFTGIMAFFPWFLMFVIGYAAYIVYRRGRGE